MSAPDGSIESWSVWQYGKRKLFSVKQEVQKKLNLREPNISLLFCALIRS
jgi:hypothetical protein